MPVRQNSKGKGVDGFFGQDGHEIFHVCNFAHDPPESSLLFYRPSVRFKFDEMTYLVMLFFDVLVTLFVLQSPPSPLCEWYHWIDMEQPAWALHEIEERQHRAWASIHEDERQEEEAARRKAKQEAYNKEKR
jgi:hypothetical protein